MTPKYMTNSEARRPKSEGTPKLEGRNPNKLPISKSEFGFRHSDFFRPLAAAEPLAQPGSGFGFRISIRDA